MASQVAIEKFLDARGKKTVGTAGVLGGGALAGFGARNLIEGNRNFNAATVARRAGASTAGKPFADKGLRLFRTGARKVGVGGALALGGAGLFASGIRSRRRQELGKALFAPSVVKPERPGVGLKVSKPSVAQQPRSKAPKSTNTVKSPVTSSPKPKVPSLGVSKRDNQWKNITHHQDKRAQGRATARNGRGLVSTGVAVTGASYGLSQLYPEQVGSVPSAAGGLQATYRTHRAGVESIKANPVSYSTRMAAVRRQSLKNVGMVARRNPAVAGMAAGVGIAGVGSGMWAAGRSKARVADARIEELRRKRGKRG